MPDDLLTLSTGKQIRFWSSIIGIDDQGGITEGSDHDIWHRAQKDWEDEDFNPNELTSAELREICDVAIIRWMKLKAELEGDTAMAEGR